jgi:hypothetical protein
VVEDATAQAAAEDATEEAVEAAVEVAAAGESAATEMGSFWYGKVGVQKLSRFLCDGSAVHRLDTFVEKTAFLLHAKMHGCPGTQNMRI